MNKIIKDQINKLKPSATLAINEKSNELKKRGKKIFKFGFGQSPFPIPDSIILALKNSADKNTYLPMQGLEALRSAIANDLNKNNNNQFDSDDIVVGPGTKELMFLTQLALMETYYFQRRAGSHMNRKLRLQKTKFIGFNQLVVIIGFQQQNR